MIQATAAAEVSSALKTLVDVVKAPGVAPSFAVLAVGLLAIHDAQVRLNRLLDLLRNRTGFVAVGA